jgi:hypothetical protein
LIWVLKNKKRKKVKNSNISKKTKNKNISYKNSLKIKKSPSSKTHPTHVKIPN